MLSVGDLVINVTTNTAVAEAALKGLAGSAQSTFEKISGTIDTVTQKGVALGEGFTKLIGILGAAVGVGSFATMVQGAIEAQAELAKLAERTGATVEALSAMKTSAKYAGISMDEVAKGMQKFAQSVVAAQDGTGKQANALKALGFDAVKFASQYKTTDEALLAVAKAMNQYGDGLGKTSIQQDLMGKSGANLAVFMRELAERGTDQVKVTREQAQAAKELEDSILKLKSSFGGFINALASTLVPIIQKVVDNMHIFREIAIAAIAAFVIWPLTLTIVTGAVKAYTEAAISAALATEVLGQKASVAATLLGGITLPAQLAAGGLTALRAAALLLFAAFAGWEIGKFLRENFIEARLFGIAFVDSMLTGWENLKYGAQVAWETIKYTFMNVFSALRSTFSQFLDWLGSAYEHVPFGDEAAKQFHALADAIKPAGDAAENYRATIKRLGDENTAAKAKIHALTDDMMLMEILSRDTGKELAKPKPPIVPPGTAKEIKDATAAIDQYLKALAGLEKAYAEASAKGQTQAIVNQQADLERSYNRGLVDFAEYWNQRTALQRAALSVQESQIRREIDIQTQLRASLQTAADAIRPEAFKNYGEYLIAASKANKELAEADAKLIALQGDLNVVVQKGTELGKDWIETYLIPASNGVLKLIPQLDKEIATRKLQNEEIGLTESQVIALNIARVEEMRTNALLSGNQELIAFYDKQIERLGKLKDVVAAGEAKTQAINNFRDLFGTLDQLGREAFDSLANGGRDMWQKIKESGKKILVDFLYSLTLKPFLIQIAASVTGVTAAQAANAAGTTAGGGNPLSYLLQGAQGAASSGGMLSGAVSALGIGGTAFGAAAGAGMSAGVATLGIAADAGVAAIGGVGAALGAMAAVAIPVVGIILALAFALGAFDKKPSPVKGQFIVSPGTTGFEDSAYTRTAAGNIGFADVNTQQFSGQAAQVFNQIVGGAIDAFSVRYTAEQRTRLAETLQATSFGVQEGTFTTEDFIKQYGADVLQKVVVAAFNILDPALGAVADRFKGTADEIAAFGNTLLGIYDITKAIGNVDFTQNVIAALDDATKETADKVSAFVQVVAGVGNSLDGLGPKLQALDPKTIIAFVDALGGAQATISAFTFLITNFTTGADRAAQATATLNNAWDAAGITMDDLARAGLTEVPKTHAQFLRLLNSLDLTTTHGRELANSLLTKVAPAFVAVEGTADAAAQALKQQADAGRSLYTQHFLTPAEQLAQRQGIDRSAITEASAAGTKLNDVLRGFGLDTVPATIAGIRALVAATVAKYGADSAEAQAVYAVIPAVDDLIDSMGGFGDAATTASDAATQAASDIERAWGRVAEQTDAFGQSLANLGDLAASATDFGTQLQNAVLLYGDQVDKLKKKIADPKTPAGDIAYILTPELNKTQSLLTSAAARLARFTTLSAQFDAARAESLVKLEEQYKQQVALYSGNAAALAIVNAQFQTQWDAIVKGTQAGVGGTLDQLTKLRQGIADYLKGLVISDLSPLSPTEQLRQARLAYTDTLTRAKGGDLTAMGDLTKFADAYLKEASDFYASSQSFVDIFDTVREQLAELAQTTPTGLPLPGSDPASQIASALPTEGTLASSSDVERSTKSIIDTLREMAAGTIQAQQSGTAETTTVLNRLLDRANKTATPAR